MKLLPASILVRTAFDEGYAIPSFCIWNAETAKTILQVAEDCHSPVILMNGPAEFSLINPAETSAVVRAIGKRHSVPFALLLDHGNSLALVRECLEAGYSSIMLDFSSHTLKENIAAMEKTVAMARQYGASVEGEIGAVGRIDNVTEEGLSASTLTDVKEAMQFVSTTGIDMVAISIGNSHGNYTVLPKLDFALLKRLRDALGIPLVLHGGSGTPPEDIETAISLGIAKINVASELNAAVRESLMGNWKAGHRQWVPLGLADAMADMAPVVEKWINVCRSAGKATLSASAATVEKPVA